MTTRPLIDKLTIAAESGDSDRGTSDLMIEARDALARQARVLEGLRVSLTTCSSFWCDQMARPISVDEFEDTLRAVVAELDRLMAEETR